MMTKSLCATALFLLACIGITNAQAVRQSLDDQWHFFDEASPSKTMKATVPGTVHTDLLALGEIPDPYFGQNEKDLQWVGTKNWVYKTTFSPGKAVLQKKNIELVFDGLDTYAEVILNGKQLLKADNMFRQWRANVTGLLQKKNTLEIRFRSAKNITDSLAAAIKPLVIPDNPRVYARKAQYHFGWDWGPIYITCGIWKPVYLEAYDTAPAEEEWHATQKIELVQDADSIGRSFYFRIDGKPVYMKGANYIPSDMFVTRLTRDDYRKILLTAKDANMNMLRIWGGGIYENDAFYELCDSLGIMIWQDFMFAGGMVPDDAHFFENVKQEVIYQVKRLRKYRCIVVWCGNNEIDEAWHNWGWQKQFNLHGADSAKMWQDYARLFNDSIAAWVKEYDGSRPYVSTSPKHGWGRKQSITEGDSHYWGYWWGMEDVEVFENKTGRFISEYGMQAMPNYSSIEKFTAPADRHQNSAVINHHQKAGNGFGKLLVYLHRNFLDSNKVKKLSLADYTYLSQCLQYYGLKNAIAIHRSKAPYNMGTLLWQLNDCWPVASWSITDYSRQPKAAWYAVREAYRDDVMPVRDADRPINLSLQKPNITLEWQGSNTLVLKSNVAAKYVYLSASDGLPYFSDNYFDLPPGETKKVQLTQPYKGLPQKLVVKSLYDVISQ